MHPRNNINPNDPWNSQGDYNYALMNQMQREIQDHWEFMAWLKYTHPDALQEWKAVQDVERSANRGL